MSLSTIRSTQRYNTTVKKMKIKAIIHTAEEGGYWAEVPILQGCYTQGETIEEVLENLQEVISLYAEDEPENLNPYLKNYSIVSKV